MFNQVPLEKGKFMEGFAEGLIGTQAGDSRAIPVKFPTRPSGPGAALSGKEAVFDVSGMQTGSLVTGAA